MTPTFTREHVESAARAKGRRAQQPVKAEGELLAVFVPGRLVNPLNASAWGWQKRSRTAKAWKERTAAAIYESSDWTLKGWGEWMMKPKAVHFHAHVFNRFDDDGLAASIKPIRDSLVACSILTGDAPTDGNVFSYSQEINRTARGVVVRVRLKGPLTDAGGGR